MFNVKAGTCVLYQMSYVSSFCREQKSLRVKRVGKIIWDDQLALRELHRRKYPRIKVDTLSLVFTVMDVYMNEL